MKLDIDTSLWQTKAKAAKSYGKSGCVMGYITKLIKEGKVKTLKIPEWGLELVARPLVIEAKGHFSGDKS